MIDAGQCDGRWFFSLAGVGFDAHVAAEFDRSGCRTARDADLRPRVGPRPAVVRPATLCDRRRPDRAAGPAGHDREWPPVRQRRPHRARCAARRRAAGSGGGRGALAPGVDPRIAPALHGRYRARAGSLQSGRCGASSSKTTRRSPITWTESRCRAPVGWSCRFIRASSASAPPEAWGRGQAPIARSEGVRQPYDACFPHGGNAADRLDRGVE